MKRSLTSLAIAVLTAGFVPAIAAPRPATAESVPERTTRAIVEPARPAAKGNFVAVEHPTRGSVRIVQRNGQQFVHFTGSFATDPGPALEVILYSENSVPLNIEGKGRYVSLGNLRANAGSQQYAIPASVDLSQYESVAIWCSQFDATFGYAPLP